MEVTDEQPKQDSHMARTIEMDKQKDAMLHITPEYEAGRGSSVSGIPHTTVTITEPQSLCRQTRGHRYNTGSKDKPNSDGAPLGNEKSQPVQKSGRGSSMNNSPPFSYTPVVLRKKQLEDADIGPILKWKKSGKRPFGPKVCASSAMTRYYWNSWDLLEM